MSRKNVSGFWNPKEATYRKKKRKTKRPKKVSNSTPGRDFYLSKRWDRLRRRTLKHYGLICMKCAVTNTELHVDHIKPRSLHPELQWNFLNLQVLCKACNVEKSNTDETDYRKLESAWGSLKLVLGRIGAAILDSTWGEAKTILGRIGRDSSTDPPPPPRLPRTLTYPAFITGLVLIHYNDSRASVLS